MLHRPGFRKEDLAINVAENDAGQHVLTISGERREEKKLEQQQQQQPDAAGAKDDKKSGDGNAPTSKRVYCESRSLTQFKRSFVLPRTAQPKDISAKCDNGVLSVTVPRVEAAKRASTAVAIQ